ncbi:MAG: lysylphosphatidylglycerol synthase transmembrane domain-containing protein [Pseudomonadota bacterium]|nr:lysylphosphatidylglycerol synthase transmembrane domain-containing protein [Pseudomonadota bacterium]
MPKRLLRLLPGLLVSLGFTLWFILRAHWGEVAGALKGVNLPLVVLSASVLFTEFIIRTLRWKVLLRPFAPQARTWRLFIATVIGMALNVVLPFRAGDFARPWLGSRETGTPILPLVTVAVIERVFDILGLVSVLVIMVLILPANAQAHGELVTNLKLYGSIFGVAGVVGMAIFLTLAAREHAARHIFARIVSIAPRPVADRFLYLFDGFVLGLESVRSRRALWQAGALSLLHWLNGAISIYVLFLAFGIDLPFAAACFTTVAIALTVALPQAPGFFGVFHVAIETTLVLWGLDPAPAQAFAIVFWAVSFIPVATVGAIAWWREGLSMVSLREEAARLEPSATESRAASGG